MRKATDQWATASLAGRRGVQATIDMRPPMIREGINREVKRIIGRSGCGGGPPMMCIEVCFMYCIIYMFDNVAMAGCLGVAWNSVQSAPQQQVLVAIGMRSEVKSVKCALTLSRRFNSRSDKWPLQGAMEALATSPPPP